MGLTHVQGSKSFEMLYMAYRLMAEPLVVE